MLDTLHAQKYVCVCMFIHTHTHTHTHSHTYLCMCVCMCVHVCVCVICIFVFCFNTNFRVLAVVSKRPLPFFVFFLKRTSECLRLSARDHWRLTVSFSVFPSLFSFFFAAKRPAVSVAVTFPPICICVLFFPKRKKKKNAVSVAAPRPESNIFIHK
jgi:hypothetical protein